MPILSTTLCYPNPAAPTQGVFIAKRLAAIHRHMPMQVVAPVPWFPLVRVDRGQVEKTRCDPIGDSEAPPVVYPKMFYIPGAMKSCDAAFYARALRKAIAATEYPEPIRLIESHFVWPDGVGAWRVAREIEVPFVCTIRGKLVSRIKHRSKRRRIVAMLRDADALIAVSKSLADLAEQVAGTDLRIHVIPNGVDRSVFHRTSHKGVMRDVVASAVAPPKTREAGASIQSRAVLSRVHAPKIKVNASNATATIATSESFFSSARIALPQSSARCEPDWPARLALGWSNSAKHVVSVGHLQELKGFHRLVEIWPEVRRRSGDARLILVGGDANEPGYAIRLRAQIAEVNAARQGDDHAPIRVLGRQAPREIARLLNAADLFALASRSEGWCNAIAEALACGCPVVATDVGGNREIVRDPALGRLVPFGDAEAMADAICAALAYDWDRNEIAELGGRRDWDQVAQECVDVFKPLL